MKILAISGSMRSESTNTNLLTEISHLSSEYMKIDIFNSHDQIPIFSPDQEGENTPDSVLSLCEKVANSDGIIISSPEYIRSIPGGLKNTIDWLVSRDEVIKKPITLIHASHRGSDVLESLRRVLATISENFSKDIFLQIPLIGKSKDEIKEIVNSDKNKLAVNGFIFEFSNFIKSIKVINRE